MAWMCRLLSALCVACYAPTAWAVGVGEVDLDVGGADTAFAAPQSFRVGLRAGERIEGLQVVDITVEGGVRVDVSQLDWNAVALTGGARVHASLPVSPGLYGTVGYHPNNGVAWFAYGLGVDGRVDSTLGVGARVGFEQLPGLTYLTLGAHLTVAMF